MINKKLDELAIKLLESENVPEINKMRQENPEWKPFHTFANLKDANLRSADLCGANLSGANLRDANLRYANLRDANLRGAKLWYANLRYANLRYANLRGADLRGANLRGANLHDADLLDAKLQDAKNVPAYVINITNIIPEGSIIGWKRTNEGIVKLRISHSTKRSNATTRKCRAAEAKVLELQTLDGKPYGGEYMTSKHDPTFEYRIGEVVKPDKPFDEDRWNECSTGIHFFITRYEAEQW